MFPRTVEIVEVGPREGFQYEGIGRADAIPLDRKLALVEALGRTGLRTIQVASFVHPKQVPQMADAERLLAALRLEPGVAYTGIYLNDVGLQRARRCPNLTLVSDLVLSASEAFALRNQRRTLAEDAEAARRMAELYAAIGLPVTTGNVMAAFGCNYEGPVALERVMDRVGTLAAIAEESGGRMQLLNLADTMGWADPESIRRIVASVRDRFPDTRIGLHLHDTRGLAVANAYAALAVGIDRFESAVGGLGGCPFAGQVGAAGNIATEELVFLCSRLGIETGIDLPALVGAARLAETIVGHPLPSTIVRSGPPSSIERGAPDDATTTSMQTRNPS